MSRIGGYEAIFTPGAPVRMSTYLYGREQELRDLRGLIRQAGTHPVVVGARGVGKTSLVCLGLAKEKQVVVGCNRDWQFEDLARAILAQIHASHNVVESINETSNFFSGEGGIPGAAKISSQNTTTKTDKRKGLGSTKLDAWTLFDHLRQIREKFIVIIDEYDLVSIKNIDFHHKVAELIKHLADRSEICDSRIVVVGVGQSAEALLGEHPSIERSAVEIFVRPLRKKDVYDFLSRAEKSLHFQFAQTVKNVIVEEANGYPYYFHLLGLLCIEAMLERDVRAREVTEIDFKKAQKKASYRAFRSILAKYRTAFQSTTPAETQIIVELAGRFPRHPKRIELKNQLAEKFSITNVDFDVALGVLERDKRLIYVSRSKDDIRFHDPLVPLFLRARYFPQFYPREIVHLTTNMQIDLFDEEDGDY